MIINDSAILLYNWEDAPHQYRDLSHHGGDEDYVAVVADDVLCPWWISEDGGQPFGVCSVQEIQMDGYRVFIGAHA